MKNLLAILFLLPFLASSQTEKGASPLNPQSAIRNPQSVRAVVVGISDYQDKDIPDLRFADRDAEAFAVWLRSPAGGSVPEDNISLLLGNDATNAAIGTALFSMIDICQPGDRFIFYFSGHGDVETKTRTQPGYLLTWDSPAQVYMVGALNLRDLQEIVGTLSDNKVQILLVTDACHSGKLAGESVGGTQATAMALAKQFANEVKIMSCQPNEFSLEGEQWGGGRGVFSWHLIDGLTGLSDKNNDGMVTLFEITRYLQDMVPAETAPHPQMPFSAGDLQATLNPVDAQALATLKTKKNESHANLLPTDSKGLEDQVLASADAPTRERYAAFKTAMKQGNLLEPLDSSASDLHRLLMHNEQLKPLHGLMTRDLAVALMNEAQQALNALLNDDPYEHNQWLYNPDRYARYPEYLAKAIELLGEKHFMFKTLMAKKSFFEARNLGSDQIASGTTVTRDDSLNTLRRQVLKTGLSYEPEAAYLYQALSETWWNSSYGAGLDSFFLYHNQAIALAPTWGIPRVGIVNSYIFNVIAPDWKPAEQCLLEGLALKPDSYVLTEKLASIYIRMGRFEDAVKLCEKMSTARPDLPNGYITLSSLYSRTRQYFMGEENARKSLVVDSLVMIQPITFLGRIYRDKRQYEKAAQTYRMLVAKGDDSAYGASFFPFASLKMYSHSRHYQDYYFAKFPNDDFGEILDVMNDGDRHFEKGEFLEAKKLYLKSLTLDLTPNPDFIIVISKLAQIAAFEQKLDSAEHYFQKALNYNRDLFAFWAGREAYADASIIYARFLLTQNRPADAEAQLFKAEESDPRSPDNYYGMAILHAHQNHQKEALDWLAKALEWYYPDYDEIMAEPLFQKIRKTKRFKALMRQYFPNGSDKPLVEKLAREYLPEIFNNQD